MALLNGPATAEWIEFVTRDFLFVSLYRAHTKAWERGPSVNHREAYTRFHEWRMEWWRELEEHFPEKVKNGVLKCSLSQSLFRQDTTLRSELLSAGRRSSNGLCPAAPPCMQP